MAEKQFLAKLVTCCTQIDWDTSVMKHWLSMPTSQLPAVREFQSSKFALGKTWVLLAQALKSWTCVLFQTNASSKSTDELRTWAALFPASLLPHFTAQKVRKFPGKNRSCLRASYWQGVEKQQHSVHFSWNSSFRSPPGSLRSRSPYTSCTPGHGTPIRAAIRRLC